MCGMVARLGKYDDKTFPAALERLHHRGIRATIKGNRAGTIGHVRLPIVGLGEENDQPVFKDSWLIGFVGEVLDYKEHGSSYDCDTPYVVDRWLEHGPGGLRGHDGFWSILAIDEDYDELHVVCDYLAQKPMYFRTDYPSAASEIDALIPFGAVTLDEVYLSACVKWGYCPDVRRTPYKEIYHVLPGEHVRIGGGGGYSYVVVDELKPTTVGPRDLKRLVKEAVIRRVKHADVPVACLVSGGLDSAIAWTIARDYADIRPYYVKGEPHPLDFAERNNVLAVVGSTPVTELEWVGVDYDVAARALQEPIDLGSLAPQYALSRVISERVCLTGDGADEAFGGYDRASRYDSQASDLFQELPAWHLPRLDRIMMRWCIEVRSPFLGRHVVEAALGLPWEERRGKKILKDLFRDDLPDGIADQAKIPLRTPFVCGNREQNSFELVDNLRTEFYAAREAGYV